MSDCNPLDGSRHTCKLSQSITDQGAKMLQSYRGGRTRKSLSKKKRYRYSKYAYVYKKQHTHKRKNKVRKRR